MGTGLSRILSEKEYHKESKDFSVTISEMLVAFLQFNITPRKVYC